MPLLEKIKPSTAYHEVADRIEDVIISGHIKPDEKFPSERELTEMLGTSRRTLREGLRILEERGMIEVRLGSKGGVFVKDIGMERVGDSLGLLISLKKVPLRDLAEFRVDVEGIVAKRAARKRSTNHMILLQRLIKESEKLVAMKNINRSAILDLDRKMHIVLAEISGNMIYETILKTIHNNIHKYYEHYLPLDPDILKNNCNEMKIICETIMEGNENKAYKIAAAHAKAGIQYMSPEDEEEGPKANV